MNATQRSYIYSCLGTVCGVLFLVVAIIVAMFSVGAICSKEYACASVIVAVATVGTFVLFGVCFFCYNGVVVSATAEESKRQVEVRRQNNYAAAQSEASQAAQGHSLHIK